MTNEPYHSIWEFEEKKRKEKKEISFKKNPLVEVISKCVMLVSFLHHGYFKCWRVQYLSEIFHSLAEVAPFGTQQYSGDFSRLHCAITIVSLFNPSFTPLRTNLNTVYIICNFLLP